ncbi:hypothetical protein, partial [Hafnia alvei]|uniref:hypothetical protein n=1 Tax=Hafnia alvei TaxID=569 RepID=UPI001CAA8713
PSLMRAPSGVVVNGSTAGKLFTKVTVFLSTFDSHMVAFCSFLTVLVVDKAFKLPLVILHC